MSLTIGQSATDWAREHGERFTYTAAGDNYDTPRSYLKGEGWHYNSHDGETRAIVLTMPDHRDARHAVYLVDDGRMVSPYYVAGWKDGDDAYLTLHEMPTDYHRDGTRKVRPDGRPVDMSGWLLGPSRFFHLKVK